VTTITTLLPSNVVTVNASTCNPAEVGTTVQNLLNQFGCDSIVTTITTLLPSNAVTVDATTCNPAEVGTTIQNLQNQFSCDSIVTTITTLLPSNAVNINASTCNPAEVGTTVQNLLNQFGCDSIVTTITTLLPSNAVTVDATTCTPAEVGTTVQNLLNQFSCDSIVTTITTLLPSNAVTVNATTCNPAEVGTTVQNLLNQFGCDSIVTIETTLDRGQGQPLVVQQSSCNPSDTGSLILVLINQFGCDSLVILETSLASIIINISTLNSNCLGLNGSATVTVSGGSEPFLFTVSNSNGVTNISNTNEINGLLTGSYAITVEDINGCSTTDSFTIEQNPLNTLDVTPSNSVVNLGETIQFESISLAEIINWSPSDYLSCDDCPNPVSTPDFDITYIISADDGLGCLTYDTASVTVIQPSIFVPTAFTPNGDGSNDILYVIDKNIAELIYFRIFNRWGEVVFSTDNLYIGWDGSFKNKKQEMDVYSYDLHVITTYGREIQVSGLISLLQ
jgi:gliding motility-associated-like protein